MNNTKAAAIGVGIVSRKPDDFAAPNAPDQRSGSCGLAQAHLGHQEAHGFALRHRLTNVLARVPSSPLEEENGKLKRLVADLSLDKAMLQDVISRKL
jgi:hypothetical protein